MAPRSACAVLCPVFRELEPETERGLSQLADRGYVVRLLRGSSQVDLARGTLAVRALADGFAETMWIDADIVFDPNDVETLRAHNLPFTAGLYVNKRTGGGFAAQFLDGAKAVFGAGGGLLLMRGVGFGFTHVRREVYDAIRKRLPEVAGGYDGERFVPYFMPALASPGGTLTYTADDYAFCHRAAMMGFIPKADTTIHLGHIGRYQYTWDDIPVRQTYPTLKIGIN